MVVDLIRQDEGEEIIPWKPAAFDLLQAARQELIKAKKAEPKRPLNPDRAKLLAQAIHQLEQKKEIAPPAPPQVPMVDPEELNAIREKAKEEGYQEGFETGETAGHAEGHKTGYYAAYEEGSAKGYEEGKEKGFQEGSKQGHAEAFEVGKKAGYEEGHAEGFRQGAEEGGEQSRRMAQLFSQFNENLAKAEQALAEDMLALSIEIADQILTTALEVQPDLLLPVVRQAIQTLPQANQPARILVNPSDIGMLENYLNEQGMAANCRIIGDETVEAGGCRIETESALVDATLANRRERVLGSMGVYRDWLDKRKW